MNESHSLDLSTIMYCSFSFPALTFYSVFFHVFFLFPLLLSLPPPLSSVIHLHLAVRVLGCAATLGDTGEYVPLLIPFSESGFGRQETLGWGLVISWKLIGRRWLGSCRDRGEVRRAGPHYTQGGPSQKDKTWSFGRGGGNLGPVLYGRRRGRQRHRCRVWLTKVAMTQWLITPQACCSVSAEQYIID